MNTGELYETARKILGVNQTQFAIEYCQKSESYVRVLKAEQRRMPTKVLINIWDKLDEVKPLKTHMAKKSITALQERIAKEIILRNTREQP